MSRKPIMPRSELIDLLADVFVTEGYDGTSMACLSAVTGLSKASLYHYFPGGKVDMARSVLARAGMKLQRLIINPLLSSLPAPDKLNRSLQGCLIYYSGDVPNSLMNVFTLGKGADHFLSDVQKGYAAWQKALSQLLDQGKSDDRSAMALADYAITLIEGSVVIARITQSRKPLEEATRQLSLELGEHLKGKII